VRDINGGGHRLEKHYETDEKGAKMILRGILAAAAAATFAGCVSLESSPIAGNEEEGRILDVLEDMAESQGRGKHNVSLEDGRLLRLLTEATDAKQVVEIGTANGYSAIWFCLALRNTGGRLTTHEIDAELAALARENFGRAGVDQMVTLVEGDAHEEVTRLRGPIDILFLDADKTGYIDYLDKLLPLVRPGGLVLAHNMQPGMADPRYVDAITSDPDLETIFLHKSLWSGVGVTLKKRAK
jgi:predicted O-methyltransferase YrrM